MTSPLRLLRSRAGRLARPALRVLRRAAYVALPRLPAGRTAPLAGRDGRPLVTIVLIDAFAAGGTVRTVFAWCGWLTDRYDVEVVSVYRSRDALFFPLPPGVRLTVLHDKRRRLGGLPGLLARLPALLWNDADGAYTSVSLWTDVQLVRRLRRQRSGIVVATRTALNILVAELARPSVVTMGQQHTEVTAHHPLLRAAMGPSYRRLDSLVVLTERDEEEFRVVLDGAPTRLDRIPNMVPPMGGGLASGTEKLVTSIGALRRDKGHDLLVEAFAPVARRHPDWRLVVYGDGPEGPALEQLVAARGLTGSVRLGGLTTEVGERLAEASVYVLCSRHENFGIALVEAMSKGLAVVSFDCPRGPREIVTSGVDGLLVPPEDVAALADGINRMIEDEDLRRRCAEHARVSAERFSPAAVGERWLALFDALLDVRGPA